MTARALQRAVPRVGQPRTPVVPDVYISVDIETDGPIPGPFSMLSFAMVEIGTFDGIKLSRPATPRTF